MARQFRSEHRGRVSSASNRRELVRAWLGGVGSGIARVADECSGAKGEGSPFRGADRPLPASDAAFRMWSFRQPHPVAPRQTCFPSPGPWGDYSVAEAESLTGAAQDPNDRGVLTTPVLGISCSEKQYSQEKRVIPLKYVVIMPGCLVTLRGALLRGSGREESECSESLKRATLRIRCAALCCVTGNG
jgi:hypothetical protein